MHKESSRLWIKAPIFNCVRFKLKDSGPGLNFRIQGRRLTMRGDSFGLLQFNSARLCKLETVAKSTHDSVCNAHTKPK